MTEIIQYALDYFTIFVLGGILFGVILSILDYLKRGK